MSTSPGSNWSGLHRVRELPLAPHRGPLAHKGDCGRVLIVAGSRGMAGAAGLAAKSALRGGAGLVTVAVPAGIGPVVAGYEPSYMTLSLPENALGQFNQAAKAQLESTWSTQDALAIGPGCGRSEDVTELLVSLYTKVDRPMVVDADGLNALSHHPEQLSREIGQPARILTPHVGEFARLSGADRDEIIAAREELAVDFAQTHHIVLVLKGPGTIVTDGQRVWINPTGNSGLATGGTGDVLTGLIAALVGQGLAAFEAAQLGTYLHGLAADLAVKQLSRFGLIASDLLDWLPRAWLEFAPDRDERLPAKQG